MTTVAFEVVTIGCRLWYGGSAAEFIESTDPSLLVKMHHMFWSVPLLPAGLAFFRRKRVAYALFGIAAGIVLSDLLHHFLVLPLWVGNTGWHWP